MLKALIVEDNAAYRRSLYDLLVRQFPAMQIDEAADGDEALQQALSRHFDLIFMDIRLPNGNGLHLTRNIKEARADTVICILTSHDLDEYRNAAYECGADRFLVKGDSTEAEIVAMVESLLHSRFISLIIVGSEASRQRLNELLVSRWPGMIVAEADNPSAGLLHAMSLKPNLIMIELGLPGIDLAELVQLIRSQSTDSLLIGLASNGNGHALASARHSGLDYCASLAPSGQAWLVHLIDALQPGQAHL